MQIFPHKRLIGVLGGMGPAATIDFMAKIVAATPATTDQDHVPLVVHSVPQIPPRSPAILDGSDAPFLPLLAGLRLLEQAGAEIVAMPCNSAHHWHARLARAARVRLLHIADAVADRLAREPAGRVALLATRGTIAAGIYDGRLGAGAPLITPPEPVQHGLDAAIAAVKRNDIAAARRHADAAAAALLREGADRLLLSCTELPLALAGSEFDAIAVDATQALAEACVRQSLGALAAAPLPAVAEA